MNVGDGFGMSPGKTETLLARARSLGIDLGAIEEQFVRGGGPGGQKINKTSNCVVLRYAPLELVVRCQRDRKRTINRYLALRELVDQAEMRLSPGTSLRLREIDRKRRNKSRAHRRAKAKADGATPRGPEPVA